MREDRTRIGNVLETFVFSELLKHTTTADGDYRLMYYRDADKVGVLLYDGSETMPLRDGIGAAPLSSLSGT